MLNKMKGFTLVVAASVLSFQGAEAAKKRSQWDVEKGEITGEGPAVLWRDPTDIASRDLFYDLLGPLAAEAGKPALVEMSSFTIADAPELARIFPEARFSEPVLWTQEAGAVLADEALARLREGVEVIEGSHVADPSQLEADVVVVCPGAWLRQLYDLPVHAREAERRVDE